MGLFGVSVPRPLEPPPPRSTVGEAALEVAKLELGNGEEGANNLGPALVRYRRSGPEGAWCAAFVSYCLEEGCRLIGFSCPVRRSHNAKRLFERCLKAGAAVARPMAGDIVCWHRGAAGARTGHIGIVSKVQLDGGWFSIEGNRGRFPSKVREYLHETGEPLLLGFARLS
jgi:hypothetical protein